MKSLKSDPILPLYHNATPPRSWLAWFLWFLFASLFVLALEVPPSFVYNFFNNIITYFYLAIDFFKSETGQTLVSYTKTLYSCYLEFSFTRELQERVGRNDRLIPRSLLWIFQDYPEITAYFFSRLDLIFLNKLYKKLSKDLLNFVSIQQ